MPYIDEEGGIKVSVQLNELADETPEIISQVSMKEIVDQYIDWNSTFSGDLDTQGLLKFQETLKAISDYIDSKLRNR